MDAEPQDTPFQIIAAAIGLIAMFVVCMNLIPNVRS